MNNSIKISIFGGDLRQLAVAKRLVLRYGNINIWGISEERVQDTEGLTFLENIYELIETSDIIIFPLPASGDGISLNCPLYDGSEKPKLLRIAEALPYGCTVIGGRLPQSFLQAVQNRGVRVFDYFESEDFQIKNAYTTAEAALSIAMNTLDVNIRGSKIAITGYGRIAKHLSELLLSMGAEVTVAARRESDLCWANSRGCKTLRIIEDKAWTAAFENGYDVIYNTVPTWLFDREFLTGADKKTFIVDLASAPGGVDIRAAKELGANVSWATSLPGKYAPRSAGELCADCVERIVREVAE